MGQVSTCEKTVLTLFIVWPVEALLDAVLSTYLTTKASVGTSGELSTVWLEQTEKELYNHIGCPAKVDRNKPSPNTMPYDKRIHWTAVALLVSESQELFWNSTL